MTRPLISSSKMDHALCLKLIVLTCACCIGLGQIVDDFNYECRLKSRPASVVTDSQNIGRPGKQGPIGPAGQKGEKGGQGVVSREVVVEAVGNILQNTKPKECPQYGISGVTTIYPNPFASEGIKVYCDANTDGGNWIVLQRREDGSTDFYRTWKQYTVGFGSLYGEFWIGLEKMHRLTAANEYELRIDVEDFDGNYAWAKYRIFKVGNAESKYTLTVGGYSGTATRDPLSHHNGKMFSTKDSDNDTTSGSCAVSNIGAWWYGSCHNSNLNGKYFEGGTVDAKGITWEFWKNSFYSMKFSEMKMRIIS